MNPRTRFPLYRRFTIKIIIMIHQLLLKAEEYSSLSSLNNQESWTTALRNIYCHFTAFVLHLKLLPFTLFLVKEFRLCCFLFFYLIRLLKFLSSFHFSSVGKRAFEIKKCGIYSRKSFAVTRKFKKKNKAKTLVIMKT